MRERLLTGREMEKNADEAAIARNAARGAMVAERQARREAMGVVSGGRGRLSRKVGVLLLDRRVFDDWVEERGGVEGFMKWFCAQVASGVGVREMCEHYGQEVGLLGEFLTEVPGRLERYYRAQQWVAEGLVEDTLEIAWSDSPDVVRDKLKVDTHFRVAGKWNRGRFGEDKQVGVPGVPVINFVMGVALTEAVQVVMQPPLDAVPEKQVLAMVEDDGGL